MAPRAALLRSVRNVERLPVSSRMDPVGIVRMGNPSDKWTLSDGLSVALACLGAALALILFLVDKTPITVGVMIASIVALLIYPIIHFFSSRMPRIAATAVMFALVCLFGWGVWPKKSQPQPSPPAPTSPLPQTASDAREGTNRRRVFCMITAPSTTQLHRQQNLGGATLISMRWKARSLLPGVQRLQ